MPVYLSIPLALDVPTMFVVATCVTALLGLFLLFVWVQDRVTALAWWGSAYLVGGLSVVIWSLENYLPLPVGSANALLFIACGMMWMAARIFHGRPILWGAMTAGAALWIVGCMIPDVGGSTLARVVLSSIIVATYTFLTAAELWRERRRTLLRRWPAIFVPILHGAVFLCPIPLAGLVPEDDGLLPMASGWVALFGLEVMLYVVGTAFLMLVLSKERAVSLHRDAACLDEMTGLMNRRGFHAAAQELLARQKRNGEQASVLVFDLDHFKKINDRYGHAVGDAALRVFADTAAGTLRATDLLGRFGGEEFVALLPAAIEDAAVAAERVRCAFEQAAASVGGHPLAATVSVGMAAGEPGAELSSMIAEADAALYRAKEAGRNRTAAAPAAVQPVPGAERSDRQRPAHGTPVAAR